MPKRVVMPALEMAQETGRLVTWRKHEGDAVSKGELLMDIETDKAVVEVEAEADGILAGVRVKEGDEVAVGQTIAWIVAEGEEIPAEPSAPSGRPRPPEPARPSERTGSPPAVSAGAAARPLISPKARRLAKEQGVDLGALRGSGPDGAVQAADLAAPQAAVGEEPSSVWRIMAERVTGAWTTVPQFFVARDVDASALTDLRTHLTSRTEAGSGADVTYTDLLVALTARTLENHRRLNASWVNGRIQHHESINVGIATAVEHGLVVPVIEGASRMSVPEIAGRRQELVQRARAGRLQPADIAGGTFTISNLGMYSIDAFTAIVNAPQAAILAVGRITDRVVAREGRPAVRAQMSLTLSSDHRVADGARAAAFLADLASAIEDPKALLGET